MIENTFNMWPAQCGDIWKWCGQIRLLGSECHESSGTLDFPEHPWCSFIIVATSFPVPRDSSRRFGELDGLTGFLAWYFQHVLRNSRQWARFASRKSSGCLIWACTHFVKAILQFLCHRHLSWGVASWELFSRASASYSLILSSVQTSAESDFW